MNQDPTARTLALLSLLQSRTRWTAAELADRLGCSLRTLRRDTQRLRRLGYTIAARPGPGSAYRLVPGLSIPSLLFTADEVSALVAGLHLVQTRTSDDAAASALAKLGQVLPTSLRRRAEATDLSIEMLDAAEPLVPAAGIGTVVDAVAEHGRVRFGYLDQRGSRTTRLVDPHRHVLGAEHWYLIGFDVDRGDWRTFRFDRVSDIERVPGTYRRREFPDDSVQRWLAADFGRAPTPPAVGGEHPIG